MKQLNNLIIKFNRTYEKYQVIAPDKRVLEEFDTMEKAIECAKGITDFKKIQKSKKITDVDSLCERELKKYWNNMDTYWKEV